MYIISTMFAQHSGDPLGIIVLERVAVERLQNDSKPYSFVLNFEGDDTRAYFLTAYSESEMKGWIQAIQMARYEQTSNITSYCSLSTSSDSIIVVRDLNLLEPSLIND